MDENQV
jgi:hypothetical protein